MSTNAHASTSSVARAGGLARAIFLALLLFAAPGAALADAPQPAPDAVININTATAQQLTFLPGIGASRAERIVAYREKRPFKEVVELARVKGIGLKTVRKLKPWLRVSGPTTLASRIPGERPGKKKGGGKGAEHGPTSDAP
ncbi:MAG: helix-hairpin-helix domain-containing protein [Deltaproteobacteria bacterium]|nr:helix-hairpin-helix domain-containing protein [Deltaproteobacteria bacterium]